jgi:DNA-binding NarL/FixJ family response regulator
MSIRMLIVDNQAMVRRGLTMFLNTDTALTIAGEASNGLEALAVAQEQQPDVILMDLMMPEMDGVAATRAIRQQQPGVHIIALSSSSDYALIASALLAGADSYLHKGSKTDQLLAVIKGVSEGRVLLSPDVMLRVLGELPTPEASPELSPDEIALLRLLAAGHSEVEIVQQLGQDLADLRQTMQRMQTRLSAPTRLLLVLRAMQLSLIDGPN